MIINLINALAMIFISSIWSRQGWTNILIKVSFWCLAFYNAFEAYRFYIMGA